MELPQIIKPCICVELPMEKRSLFKDKARFRTSLPTSPVQDDFSTCIPKRGTSLRSNKSSKTNLKLESYCQEKHPLFASIGDGLANWFGNGNEMTQNLQFLTWTDDFV